MYFFDLVLTQGNCMGKEATYSQRQPHCTCQCGKSNFEYLCLPFKLWIGNLDCNNAGETFPRMLTR